MAKKKVQPSAQQQEDALFNAFWADFNHMLTLLMFKVLLDKTSQSKEERDSKLAATLSEWKKRILIDVNAEIDGYSLLRHTLPKGSPDEEVLRAKLLKAIVRVEKAARKVLTTDENPS